MVLPKVAAFDATVHNEDTTLSHEIEAINRTKVLFHCLACKKATEVVMLSCSLKFNRSVIVKLITFTFQYYGGGG